MGLTRIVRLSSVPCVNPCRPGRAIIRVEVPLPTTILHLADLHLGAPHTYLGDGATARAREADGVLERLAAWLTGTDAPKVGAVLIAGDLFDDPRPSEALAERAVRSLRQIEEAGIATITLPGNHDEWTYPDGVFRRYEKNWPGRLVTESEPAVVAMVDLGGVGAEIVSCAFLQGRNPPPPQWKSPLPAVRDPGVRRVGLFHGTLTRLGSFIAEGPRAFPLDLDRLAAWGLDYLALGHIHKRQDFRSGSCLALYPGPIEGLGFADGGSPVMTIVDLSGEAAQLKPIDARAAGIRRRDVLQHPIEMTGIADESHLEARIAEVADPGAPRPIVKVLLRGRPAFAVRVDEIRRKMAGSFEHLVIEAESAGADLGAWESLAGQRTLEGTFVAKVLALRDAETDPQRASFWDEVAGAGLRALGRGQG